MKCKIDGKDYQNGTNLLKVHNGNSFANLHARLKLELLQSLLLKKIRPRILLNLSNINPLLRW